jgi:hypothetical protein
VERKLLCLRYSLTQAGKALMGHSHRLHNGKRHCTSPISASFFVLIGAILVRKNSSSSRSTHLHSSNNHLHNTDTPLYLVPGLLYPWLIALTAFHLLPAVRCHGFYLSLSYALPLVTVTCSPPLDSTIDLLQRLARYASPRFRRTATPVSGHHRNQAARRYLITITLA